MLIHGRISIALLLSLALLASGVAARSQQGGDVTVIIKAKSKPVDLPTLLVMCDLACNWKLDGEAKGHIDTSGSAKVKVEAGQHMVEATTEDGIDQVKQPSAVKPTGQMMVDIEFQPIRDARLEADRKAQTKAEQEARDKAAHEQQEKDRQEREAQEKELQAKKRAAKEEAEGQPWTDPDTGLMWAKKDSGDDNDLTWRQAVEYCHNLQLADHSDWRLPTISELDGIYDPTVNIQFSCCSNRGGWSGKWHVKGDLELTGWQWSSTTGGRYGPEWYFFGHRKGRLIPLGFDKYAPRALCVRRSGE